MSDENVDFLPLNPVLFLKGVADDGNLEVRRLQYSYNLDADDSETASLELARREATRGKWDEETISPYYRQRHYDPNPAQFVSEDPLGFDGGDKNLYGYVGNSPVNYTDPTGLIAEGFLDTLGNKLEGAAYEIAGFVVRNVHEPVGRSLADNYALESALRTGDSIAVGVAQTGNFVGFDIREFREDLYGEEVNDNLNETIVTISTAGTLVLGGFALSAYAAGSAAFNTTATAAINTGLINAGIGLTTQLIFNEGNSSNLDYGSLALDFGFGTLGSFVGAGVAAKTGGGLVSRIGFSTAFEGAFAGGEQVVRNLANGGSWSQDVSSAILSSIVFQGGSEILSNGREILLAGGRLLRAGDNLADDLLGAFGGRRLATPDGLGDDFFRSVDEVPNVPKGGDRFAAVIGQNNKASSNTTNSNVLFTRVRSSNDFGTSPTGHPVLAEIEEGTVGDFIIESAKPSTKNRVVQIYQYENPGHHDPTGGAVPYNPKKSVLPKKHIDLFEKSIPFTHNNGEVRRYAKDEFGHIHRFEPSIDRVYHWSGSTNGVTLKGKELKLKVPSDVRKLLK